MEHRSDSTDCHDNVSTESELKRIFGLMCCGLVPLLNRSLNPVLGGNSGAN
jgi:hypothetical protein